MEYRVNVTATMDYEKLLYHVIEAADIDTQWLIDEIKAHPFNFVKINVE
jgi:hypothetical protein